jgi:iron(III) transport system permease protein
VAELRDVVALPRRGSESGTGVLFTSVLLVVAVTALYPVILIVLNSFQIERPGEPPTWGLDGWRIALTQPGIATSVWNTIAVLLARQALAFPLAIFIAWLLGRTDIPGSHWLELAFWVAFFLPSLAFTLGWILVFDPGYGFANQLLRGVVGGETGPLNIYSFWGIVWTHLGSYTTAVKVMLLTPAFRNIDSGLEEASRVCGARRLGTLVRITLPAMAPALLVVLVISMMRGMQAFEIELILGAPAKFYVYSTKIYDLVLQEPPHYGPAMALATIALGLLTPLIVLQHWVSHRRHYTTVGGQHQARRVALGRWRYPAFVLVAGVIGIITVLPVTFLVLGSFMKLFGFFTIPDPWTTANWARVVEDEIFGRSLRNTLVLAGVSALAAVLFYSLVAYLLARTRHPGRRLLDFISWLPFAIPGVLLSVGFLWLFLGTPGLRWLYGSMALLVVSTVVSGMPFGVHVIKANLLQLGGELEEASRVAGGTWWATYRRVVLPLVMPTLMVVMVVTFISAARDISNVALLATSETRVLSLLQLDYMIAGRYEQAAVVATLTVLLTTGVAVVARIVGLRIGIVSGADGERGGGHG